MDDPLLFMLTKKSHIAKLEDLLKELLKNGLKISPKKCQLFRKELQYRKYYIDRVCIKLWCSVVVRSSTFVTLSATHH